MIWMLLLALSAPTLNDHFDVVEVNHVYDKSGQLLFDQLLWRNWHESGHRVEAWKLMKNARDTSDEAHFQKWKDRVYASGQLLSNRCYKGKYIGGPLHPKKIGDLYHVEFREGENRDVRRIITARTFNETWTVGDNEVRDKKYLREELRVGLEQLPGVDQ